MKHRRPPPFAVIIAMAASLGNPVVAASDSSDLRGTVVAVSETVATASRTEGLSGEVTPAESQSKAFGTKAGRISPMTVAHLLLGLGIFCIVCMMFPQGAGAQMGNLRLPPRWEPSLEGTTPFRTWVQDLMLWTIATDMTPPQQCAAIISQLGGAARDLARTLTPAEVYQGGIINGQHLDPVSFLLHGLHSRVAPLDDESRLRATQDLLSFTRRTGETVDTLVSRFEITRRRAQDEGGGNMPVETSALLLLRACNVSPEQFQSLTQPFGLRLPSTEAELSQMVHSLRRLGHIVERFPNNIASGLRPGAAQSHTYLAEADTGSSTSAWGPEQTATDWQMPFEPNLDWAFAAVSNDPQLSDTDSATSSDQDEAMDVADLQGLTNTQADEYLFGEYQHAKRRWRRFTGKPVRAVRRVIRKKGKGKGKRSNSFLNIDGMFQSSSFFRGKGKGGKSSGKGFGRKLNPSGRDGEPLKCSICASQYHLRARCPRRESSGANPSSSTPAQQQSGPSFAVNPAGLHFASFEPSDESSWANITTPRSGTSSYARPSANPGAAQTAPSEASQPQAARAVPPEAYNMSPDPWSVNADPWMEWYQDHSVSQGDESIGLPDVEVGMPSGASGWFMPGIGDVGRRTSFNETIGSRTAPPAVGPQAASSSSTIPAWLAPLQQTASYSGQVTHRAAGISATDRAAPPGHSPFAQQISAGMFSVSGNVSTGAVGGESVFAAQSGTAAVRAAAQTASQTPLAATVPLHEFGGSGPPQAPLTPSAPALNPLAMFGQVHALRAEHRQQSRASREHVPEPQLPRREYQSHGTVCSICQDEFTPGDHICRMVCGHMFHAICVGELMMHTAADDSNEPAVECPNCRAWTTVRRSWRYPQMRASEVEETPPEAPQGSRPGEQEPVYPSEQPPVADPSTPENRAQPEEFHTPSEQAESYPWWPVPNHCELTPRDTAQAYHTSVRLSDGRPGLLVDPGSYGNLVGEQWLANAAAGIGQAPETMRRANPLQVGGVGAGAQTCHVDCRLPMQLQRSDGSQASSSFASPVVHGSGCPALLGLKSLQNHRAILDMSTNMLHFAGTGDVAILLPEGSESFKLEPAQSGHLLLPFSGANSRAPPDHHLFADGRTEAPDQVDAGDSVKAESEPQETATCHLTLSSAEEIARDEEACQRVLEDFSFEAASALVQRLFRNANSSDQNGRFKDTCGFSECFGSYVYGGQAGITKATRARPKLAALLFRMMREREPSCVCTAISVNVSLQSPVHIDKYNQEQNYILPLVMPRSGGHLWLQLREGDTVRGEPAIRELGGEPCIGCHVPLKVGVVTSFCPKANHATQPWARGDRLVLAAYVTGSCSKLSSEDQEFLHSLGASVPDSIGKQAPPAFASEEPPAAPPSEVGAAHRKKPSKAQGRGEANKSVRFSVLNPVSVIRRVLLITLYHSTCAAFLSQGWEPLRFRPLELLRDGFDDAVSRLKRAEFEAVWIDVSDARQWAGQDRTTQVCNRISVIMNWASRQSVPVYVAALRRVAWQHPAVQHLLQVHKDDLHVSHHCWCHFNIKLCSSTVASSVKYKVYSTKPLQDHQCTCAPGVEHTFDLDRCKGEGQAKQRAKAEEAVLSRLIAVLGRATDMDRWPLERPGPAKPPDSLCHRAYHQCSSCGLSQLDAVCTVCDETSRAVPDRQEIPVRQDGAAVSCDNVSGAPSSNDVVQSSLRQDSFPTDQKLLQKQREAEQKALGQVATTRRKKQTVEQHFDDCGDDLSSLTPPRRSYLTEFTSESEDEDAGSGRHVLAPQLSMFVLWAMRGPQTRDLRPSAILAADLEEMFTILALPSNQAVGWEIVELCNGDGNASFLNISRRISDGRSLELTTQADLTAQTAQRHVLEYTKSAKPLVTILNPAVTAQQSAAEFISFCGAVALAQRDQGRHFLVAQPFPSSMFQMQPWPDVVKLPDCYAVTLHQCCVNQRVGGKLIKNPLQFLATSAELLQPFAGLECRGGHVHSPIPGDPARQAQSWSHAMCDRLAYGIERLVEWETRQAHSTASSFPSVGAGPQDTGSVEVDAAWRRCKGCLWRLQKHDKAHTRIRGECKHPDVEPLEFLCPGCVARKSRADSTHTYGPDCRHALTKPRQPASRRPYGRPPAHQEPTAALRRGAELGAADEQAAEDATAAGPALRQAEPAEPTGVSRAEPSSSSSAGPIASQQRPVPMPDEVIDPRGDEAVSAGRGPDREPRERRTWTEADVQTSSPADWTAFDVQASLRGLRHADEAGRRRILRKLHLRWWHASSDKMTRLLKASGLSKEITDLIPEITQTCRVCRHWARPMPDARATSSLVVGFNIEVEGDLMFYRHHGTQHIILVLTDRGVRWTSTAVIPDKSTATLLTALDQVLISIFGPPQVLIFDGETGLNDDESTEWFQLRGVTKRTSAPNQHTRIVDRKISVLRDAPHKLFTQLHEEGVQVPFSRGVSEATFAINALTSINGLSPYNAVLGRTPSILPNEANVMGDTDSGPMSRHCFRLREVAVQAIAEGSAQERMKRAMNSQTRPSGEQLEFELGSAVDYWRQPLNKETSGWRGPAKVVDLTRLEHGRVGIRTSTDQVLTCRLQDLRHSLAYISCELVAFFDYSTPVASQSGIAQQLVQDYVDDMKSGAVLTLGFVKTSQGSWIETPQTQDHRVIYQACLYLAETVFHMPSVTAVRLARAVRNLTSRAEFTNALTLWWTSAGTRNINFIHSDHSKVSTVELLNTEWPSIRAIQLLSTPDQEEWVAAEKWSVPSAGAPSAEHVNADASSTSGRLSTVPEATNESDSIVSLQDLQAMFGHDVSPSEVPNLETAYIACATESTEALPPAQHVTIQAHAASAYEAGDDVPCIPSWDEARIGISEESELVCSEQVFAAVATQLNADPHEFVALDSDEHGAYVALEAHGDMAKVVEGLPRMPNSDEHAEIRMYESHSRKAVIDRSDDLLTDDEVRQNAAAVTQAVLDELKTWSGFKCFKRRPRSQAPCIIDAKWVYKWKYVKGIRKIRARLCLRGFKETGADDQSNFSATASRFSQRLIVSECVARQWVIASSDVPKAFLQGVSYSELASATQRPERDVSFELAGEGLRCLQMLPEFQGFDSRKEVLHCLKPGTGCRDAPKCFNLKLREVTEAFGFQCCSVDSEMELLIRARQLIMVIVKHVDDLKMIGKRAIIQQFVEHLEKTFGKMDIEWGDFTFCGVRHQQHTDGSISLDQMKFLAACRPIVRPTAVAGAPTTPLKEDDRRQFLSLVMTVAYGLLTRPDAAVFITALQRESHQAQVVHVRRLNAVLKWLQENPSSMTYPKFDSYPDMLLQISDSSYRAKAEDGLSVRGLVSVRVCERDLSSGAKVAVCHLVDFVSKAQRHVTRSTFSSELFAATDATDIGLLHTLAVHELVHGIVSASQAKELMEGTVPCTTALGLVVDAKSVSSAIVAPNLKIPAEPSLLLHVAWLRALLRSKRLKALFWSDTRSMVADALTKGSVSRELVRAVMAGRLIMDQAYEQQVLS